MENYDAAVVMSHAARRLARELTGTLSYETIEREISLDYQQLAANARVSRFLPILVERAVRERLRATLAATAPPPNRILFVCTRNSGRSQMAAAFARRACGERIEIDSAGPDPALELQQHVLVAMAEVGIDLAGLSPRRLTEDLLLAADVVVTLGCGDAVPVAAGIRYVDWDVADPFGCDMDDVRRIRADVDRRVGRLLDELLPVATAGAG